MTNLTRATKYVVLAEGITFPDADGKEVRAKQGDVVSGINPSSARHELRDGKIELARKEVKE